MSDRPAPVPRNGTLRAVFIVAGFVLQLSAFIGSVVYMGSRIEAKLEVQTAILDRHLLDPSIHHNRLNEISARLDAHERSAERHESDKEKRLRIREEMDRFHRRQRP